MGVDGWNQIKKQPDFTNHHKKRQITGKSIWTSKNQKNNLVLLLTMTTNTAERFQKELEQLNQNVSQFVLFVLEGYDNHAVRHP